MATREQVQQVARAVKSDMDKAVAAATRRFSSPAFAAGDARTTLQNTTVSRLGQLQSRNPDLFSAYARSIGAQPSLDSVQAKLNDRAGTAVQSAMIFAPRSASPASGRSSGS